MKRDYYVLQWKKLNSNMSALEQAIIALEEAKKRDSNEYKRLAIKIIQIVGHPHLAYLWFAAIKAKVANAIREAWQEVLPDTIKAIPDVFGFVPDVEDEEKFIFLPLYSFALKIPFQLEKPYMSRDDVDFYLLDSPLRKEKIFKVPTVASTSWKGALRAALWQLGYEEDNEVIIRLLGNSRESDEKQAGRLYFYPTFFDKISFEVINPHHHETGVGQGPILMECVPRGAAGILQILYVPFGRPDQNERECRAEVAGDLEVLVKGVHAMLTTCGFGAKTSSGFGTVKDQLNDRGALILRAKTTDADVPPAEDSPPSSEVNHLESKPEEIPQLTGKPHVSKWTFSTLGELCQVARQVAAKLREGGLR
ncbi:hypothetical protein PTH_0708 [Pelotomaculum thermopropionicum SI]|uniref:CRISPR type III-associated protein domain-containing protein n=1 Tax=Pelotomaculum thermopropionicum (strain DSM 13744 / JCM 10971 / SI) TaxID=370438 RepID=A5D4F8_PELTS|nr:hypothetical protein PTH_0708 [Pelotomaculum thermopropionicum SI]